MLLSTASGTLECYIASLITKYIRSDIASSCCTHGRHKRPKITPRDGASSKAIPAIELRLRLGVRARHAIRTRTCSPILGRCLRPRPQPAVLSSPENAAPKGCVAARLTPTRPPGRPSCRSQPDDTRGETWSPTQWGVVSHATFNRYYCPSVLPLWGICAVHCNTALLSPQLAGYATVVVVTGKNQVLSRLLWLQLAQIKY